MQAIGLCRFSYPTHGGFQVEHETIQDRISYLYAPDRMEERFRHFECVALPCIRNQTDTEFDLIVLIGNQMPEHYLARLYDLTADIPQIHIHAEKPRKHREVMKEILNAARNDPDAPCLQFRFDDDDAVAVDFIENLRQAAKDCAALSAKHRAIAFDWSKGYVAEFGPKGIAASELFRPYFTAALAVQIRGGATATIMNFAHHKINQHMPTVTFNNPPMFVRGHNNSNDSRQKNVKHIHVTPLGHAEEDMFRSRFAINADQVRRVFAKA